MDTLNREELIRYLRQLSLKYSWKEQFEYSTSAPAELNFDGDCGSQEDYIEENNSIIKHSRSDVKLRRIIINTDSASDEDIQRMRAVTSEVIDSSSGALCSKYQATTQIDGDDEINEYLTNNSFDTEKLVEEPCSSPESTIKIQPKSGRRRIICDSEDEEEEEEEEEQSSGHKKTPNTQLLLTVDLCSPLVPAKKVVKPVLMEARPARRARRVILSDSEEEGEIVQESEGSFLVSRTRQGGGVAADSEDEALVDSDCSSTESWIVDEEGSVDSNSSRSDWEEAEEGDGSDDYSSSSCHDQDSDLEEADKENHSSNNSPIHQTAAGKSTSNSSSRGSKSTATPRKGLPFQRSTSPILSKTPSRTERNQQRVEALSTGLKSRRGPAYHHALAQDLFQIYNEVIFDSRLPADLAVTWNKRLLTTAGYCRCKKLACTDGSGSRRRLAAIELSNKVNSTPMCSAQYVCTTKCALCLSVLYCRCATARNACGRRSCTRCATPPPGSSTGWIAWTTGPPSDVGVAAPPSAFRRSAR